MPISILAHGPAPQVRKVTYKYKGVLLSCRPLCKPVYLYYGHTVQVKFVHSFLTSAFFHWTSVGDDKHTSNKTLILRFYSEVWSVSCLRLLFPSRFIKLLLFSADSLKSQALLNMQSSEQCLHWLVDPAVSSNLDGQFTFSGVYVNGLENTSTSPCHKRQLHFPWYRA